MQLFISVIQINRKHCTVLLHTDNLYRGFLLKENVLVFPEKTQ